MKKKFAVLVLAIGLVLPFVAAARTGVSINVGKIEVEEVLRPGIINILPPVTVINNGDETSEYQLSVQYHSGQESDPDKGLAPPRDWFLFKPQTFHLEPGGSQVVEMSVVLPINAKPGRYFAYLDARPAIKTGQGGTSIGIAVATQLWFDVAPANIFWGIYYRALSLYGMWSFWVNLVTAIIAAAIFVAVFRRFFALNIGLRGRGSPAPSEKKIETGARKTARRGRPRRL